MACDETRPEAHQCGAAGIFFLSPIRCSCLWQHGALLLLLLSPIRCCGFHQHCCDIAIVFFHQYDTSIQHFHDCGGVCCFHKYVLPFPLCTSPSDDVHVCCRPTYCGGQFTPFGIHQPHQAGGAAQKGGQLNTGVVFLFLAVRTNNFASQRMVALQRKKESNEHGSVLEYIYRKKFCVCIYTVAFVFFAECSPPIAGVGE